MRIAAALLLCFMLSHGEALRENVVAGTQAMEGQFPYMAALFQKGRDSDYAFFCSGSIIGKRWILTAAHCTYDVENMKDGTLRAEDCDETFVVVGEVFATSKSKMHTVRKCHRMPIYTNTYFFIKYIDVALLELAEALVWTPSVSPIRLGPLRTKNRVKNVVAVGYGLESEAEQKHPTFDNRTLNYIVLKPVSFQECSKYHKLNRRNHICARSSVYGGICNGDSGGPLVDTKNANQVGITSFSLECTGKSPTVFSRVTYFLPWIEVVTGWRFK